MLLQYLLDFFSRVIQHSDKNKMHINNLVTIFGPSLLRTSAEGLESLVLDGAAVYEVLKALILHRGRIFGEQV